MRVHLKRSLVQNIKDFYDDLGLDGSEHSSKITKMLNLAALKKHQNDELHYPVFESACDRMKSDELACAPDCTCVYKFKFEFNIVP